MSFSAVGVCMVGDVSQAQVQGGQAGDQAGHPRSLFLMGHPGHELRVWGLLHAWRPGVLVITDGSGSTGAPRLSQTAALLAAAGARPCPPFGAFTDAAIYEALLAGDFAWLIALAERLAASLVEDEVELVACDALEGYNPTHDLCSLLLGAALPVAARRGRTVAAYEFAVVGTGGADGAGALVYELSGDRLDAKVAAARAYAGAAGAVLAREVEELLATAGPAAFARECLVPLQRVPLVDRFAGRRPFFETHGERRVREGKYRAALRLHDHLVPFERALAAWSASA